MTRSTVDVFGLTKCGALTPLCLTKIFSMLVLRNERRLALQKAQMSTGPSGGGSSDNTKYYVLVGATFLGGAVYVSMFFFYVVKQLIA